MFHHLAFVTKLTCDVVCLPHPPITPSQSMRLCNCVTETLQKHKWENAVPLDRSSWGFVRNSPLSDYLSIESLITTLIKTVRYCRIHWSCLCCLFQFWRRIFSDAAPVSLFDLLHVYVPSRRHCSSSNSGYSPRVETKAFGHCSSVWKSAS